MPGPELYVARAEPYRLSDLEHWLASIRGNPQVAITMIGKTAEGPRWKSSESATPKHRTACSCARGHTPGSRGATGSSKASSTVC